MLDPASGPGPPSPHRGSLRAPPGARPPAAPAPDPEPTSQAHKIYKRKDSTSQSSADSMATPLPVPHFRRLTSASGNLPRQARPSREEWARPALAGRRGPRPGGGAVRRLSAFTSAQCARRAGSGILLAKTPGKMT